LPPETPRGPAGGAKGGRHARRYSAEEFKTTDERNTRFQGPNPVDGGRNIRSVWDIPTQPYPDAHFATYPEELVRRCILAGTSERGCCPKCGTPWEREIDAKPSTEGRENWAGQQASKNGASRKGGFYDAERTTLGWRPGCLCPPVVKGVIPDTLPQYADPIPCTVLDPFLGSGTTAYIARKHGRRSIGIELAESYCALSAKRMQQQRLPI
jgi:hypothetical protein